VHLVGQIIRLCAACAALARAALAFAGRPPAPRADRRGDVLLAIAVALHLLILGARAYAVRFIPLGGISDVLVLLSLLVLVVFRLAGQPLQQAPIVAAACAASAALLAASMLSPSADALPAALRSAMLPVHVIGAISAYACLTLNFVLCTYLALRGLRQRPPAALPTGAEVLAKRSALLGWALYGGFALVAGAIWAKLAWGRLWGWDPKETLSLIVFCAYSLYVYFEVVVWPRSRVLCCVLSALAYAALLASVISGARLAGLHSSHQVP